MRSVAVGVVQLGAQRNVGMDQHVACDNCPSDLNFFKARGKAFPAIVSFVCCSREIMLLFLFGLPFPALPTALGALPSVLPPLGNNSNDRKAPTYE